VPVIIETEIPPDWRLVHLAQLYDHGRDPESHTRRIRRRSGAVHGHEQDRTKTSRPAAAEAARAGEIRVAVSHRRVRSRLRGKRGRAGDRPAPRPFGHPVGVVLVPARRNIGSGTRRGLHGESIRRLRRGCIQAKETLPLVARRPCSRSSASSVDGHFALTVWGATPGLVVRPPPTESRSPSDTDG